MKLALSTAIDASAERVWQEVRTSRLLHYVCRPLQTFVPIDPFVLPDQWVEGRYLVQIRLFGLIPIGVQWLVISFPDNEAPNCYQLRDNGYGSWVKRWDHRIKIRARPDGQCDYTDEVEIKAGIATPLVWVFASLLYRHRQRRWRDLAKAKFVYP